MLRLFRWFLLTVILVFALGSIAIAIDGQFDNLRPADLAVVLGSKVNRDGQPSDGLKVRLDHTVDLYRQGYCKCILVSGGHGWEGFDEPVVMRRYLQNAGIPSAIVFEDNGGSNTWHTAQDTALFLKEHDLKSVLIVSEYFHIPRCRLAFAKFGIHPIYWSHAHLWARRNFYSLPREVVGYVGYYFRNSTS
jgi:vancomycin permeability regulator SanA